MSYLKKIGNIVVGKGKKCCYLLTYICVPLYLTDLMDKQFTDHVITATVYSITCTRSLRGFLIQQITHLYKAYWIMQKKNNSKPVNKKKH